MGQTVGVEGTESGHGAPPVPSEKLIITGDLVHLEEALRVFRGEERALRADWLKIGHGWSFRSSKYLGASFWMSRTKSGFSIRIQTFAGSSASEPAEGKSLAEPNLGDGR